METRSILIVNGDKKARKELTQFFEDSHFEVTSTPSAAYTIAKIVQGNKPIIIVGDTFEEQISAAQVIALLRRVDKHLKIILISDNASLETLKKIREDGIYYHSLKPRNIQDNEELLTVIQHALA